MNAFVTENFVLLGIGLLVIALRLYARVSAVGITKLQADDYLMVAAAVRPCPLLCLFSEEATSSEIGTQLLTWLHLPI